MKNAQKNVFGLFWAQFGHIFGPNFLNFKHLYFFVQNETKWTQNVKNVFLAHFLAIFGPFFGKNRGPYDACLLV